MLIDKWAAQKFTSKISFCRGHYTAYSSMLCFYTNNASQASESDSKKLLSFFRLTTAKNVNSERGRLKPAVNLDICQSKQYFLLPN